MSKVTLQRSRVVSRGWWVSVIVVVGVLLTGCSSTSVKTPEPTIGTIPVITEPSQIPRPIDTYLPGETEIVNLHIAYYALVNDCFAKHGITITAYMYSNLDDLKRNVHIDVLERVMLTKLYGDFDPDGASTNGYAPGGRLGRAGNIVGLVAPPQDDPLHATAMACWEAVGQVDPTNGAIDMGMVTQQQLPDGGPTVNPQDSRMVAVYQQWAACMAEKGFTYPDPRSAYFDSRWSQDGMQTLEVATAVADMNCKISTNLVGVAVAVQSAYDQVYIDSHRDALNTWKQKLDALLSGTATLPDISQFMTTTPGGNPS
ncbi:MAG: hypothetical protein FWF43_08220 [Propionibacteriaceae bacterium]|nr:hypothetical protein [Propionibacteriaceae bacterium]